MEKILFGGLYGNVNVGVESVISIVFEMIFSYLSGIMVISI